MQAVDISDFLIKILDAHDFSNNKIVSNQKACFVLNYIIIVSAQRRGMGVFAAVDWGVQ